MAARLVKLFLGDHIPRDIACRSVALAEGVQLRNLGARTIGKRANFPGLKLHCDFLMTTRHPTNPKANGRSRS